jgi:hypothetical protein
MTINNNKKKKKKPKTKKLSFATNNVMYKYVTFHK